MASASNNVKMVEEIKSMRKRLYEITLKLSRDDA